jgi:hypothetical protein
MFAVTSLGDSNLQLELLGRRGGDSSKTQAQYMDRQ